MFEEIAVWQRADADYAIRYVGFRAIETGMVWIAFANHLSQDDSRNLRSDEMVAPQATLEALLNDVPVNPTLWKASLSEAIDLFRSLHPET